MARKENTTDVTGGLSYGAAARAAKEAQERQTGPKPNIEAAGAKNDEKVKQTATTTSDLAAVYDKKRESEAEVEAKSVRIQLLTTPTVAKKLNQLVADERIRSRNDLINFLLVKYFEALESGEE